MNHSPFHPSVPDEEYIRDIRAGGLRAEAAIRGLYLRYRNTTYTHLHKLVSRNNAYRGVTEDLLHDAFIILIDKLRQDHMSVRHVGGFWVGIGKMVYLNQLKKDERTVLVHDVEETYGLEDESTDAYRSPYEENEKLEAAFMKLGERCQQILLLWVNRFSMEEIAQQMHLPNEGMARKIKFQCFKKLKAFIQLGTISPG